MVEPFGIERPGAQVSHSCGRQNRAEQGRTAPKPSAPSARRLRAAIASRICLTAEAECGVCFFLLLHCPSKDCFMRSFLATSTCSFVALAIAAPALAGDNTLIFKSLPLTLDPASLRLEGEGSAKVTIGAVDSQVDPAETASPDN